MLNLRADALTAACSGDYQSGDHDWYQSSSLPVTNWCYSCPIDTACLHRHIRNGISCACTAWPNQLPSLHCAKLQVKKLRLPPKLYHKLRGISEVPPQRITLQRSGNYINLVAFGIVARSQRAMKSVKHRKFLCCCFVPQKDLARLQKSIMPIYRSPLTKMSCKSNRTHIKVDEDKAHTRERTLSGF